MCPLPCCTRHRYLRDVGRSVSAYGYWGDVINPPYHAFGTTSSDPALFKVVNKQFSHTAVDVAEHNVMVRSGEALPAATRCSTCCGCFRPLTPPPRDCCNSLGVPSDCCNSLGVNGLLTTISQDCGSHLIVTIIAWIISRPPTQCDPLTMVASVSLTVCSIHYLKILLLRGLCPCLLLLLTVQEIIKQLSESAAMGSTADGAGTQTQAAAQAAHNTGPSSTGEPHRARAARGPTSLEHLVAASSAAQEQRASAAPLSSTACAVTAAAECKGARVTDTDTDDVKLAAKEAQDAAAGAVDQATGRLQELSVNPQHQLAQKKSDDNQQQQQQWQQEQREQPSIEPLPMQPELQQGMATAATQAAMGEAAQMSAAVQQMLASVRVYLLTGDLKRSLTGKAVNAGRFAAATVGHRHAHMLGSDYGLASVLQPGAPVFVETAANMVQLTTEQVAAFDSKLLELAAAAGYEQHPGFSTAQQTQSEQQGAPDPAVVGAGGQQAARASSNSIDGQWQMPPGHLALCAKPCVS